MTLAAGGLLGLPLAWEQMYLWATHLVAIPDGGACAAGNSDLPINNLSKCAKPHRNEKTFWAACAAAAAAAAFWAGAGAGAADAVCPGL